MRSVQPPSSLRPTPVLPRPANLVRLTLDGLDAWTSNPVLHGLGGCLRDSILAACWDPRIILAGTPRAAFRRRNRRTAPVAPATDIDKASATAINSAVALYRPTEAETINTMAQIGRPAAAEIENGTDKSVFTLLTIARRAAKFKVEVYNAV
jgi:hypothetical protein